MYALKGRDERRQGMALAQISDSSLGGIVRNFFREKWQFQFMTGMTGRPSLHITQQSSSYPNNSIAATNMPNIQDVSAMISNCEH
jgi:hypothetical protein